MRRTDLVALAVVSLLGLGIASGCTQPDSPAEPVPPTEPTPGPRPRYEPAPRDLCYQVDINEVADWFDLSIPTEYDPSGEYRDARTNSGITCWFRGVAVDDRFATEAFRFEPNGTVGIWVYHEPSHARDHYDRTRGQLARIGEDRNDTVAAMDGWWDDGQYLEHVEDQGQPEGVGPVSYVQIISGFYQVNLYVEASMEANPNSEDVAEATAVMHELLRALLDETVRHLDRSD